MKWEEHEQEGLHMIPRMEAAGFKAIFNQEDVIAGRITPDNPPDVIPDFKDDTIHVWQASLNGDSPLVWMVWDMEKESMDWDEYPTLEAFLASLTYQAEDDGEVKENN